MIKIIGGRNRLERTQKDRFLPPVRKREIPYAVKHPTTNTNRRLLNAIKRLCLMLKRILGNEAATP